MLLLGPIGSCARSQLALLQSEPSTGRDASAAIQLVAEKQGRKDKWSRVAEIATCMKDGEILLKHVVKFNRVPVRQDASKKGTATAEAHDF